MSERKVIQKYYPPNFDPSKIPRRRIPKDVQHKVRLMTPFSMRCNTCGEYIYKGKKFNARKETVQDEMYLKIRIFRFYIRCTRCSAEITFKTDPANLDYVAEHGAQRNFEPWRDTEAADEEQRVKRLLDEELNPMRALENKTETSKRELDIMDALDEIRTRNARAEKIDVDKMIDELGAEESERQAQAIEEEEEELDRLAKQAFRASSLSSSVPAGSRGEMSHLYGYHNDEDGGDDEEGEEVDLVALLNNQSKGIGSSFTTTVTNPNQGSSTSTNIPKKRKTVASDFGIVVASKKSAIASTSVEAVKPSPQPLIVDYGSSSESDP